MVSAVPDFVSPDQIRARFAAGLSALYRAEVPLYAALRDIVAAVEAEMAGGSDGGAVERHGAIRVGTPDEMRLVARLFAVMGLHPVGYYDLAPVGVPVHSTAFRPITAEALAINPLRVFTSLLRLDLVEDPALRAEAAAILARRTIVAPATLALVERAETAGGLTPGEAEAFIAGALDVFRWHGTARVDAATYQRLLGAHRLVADVVAFGGPHINHLTPHSRDIDRVQAEMAARGLPAKATIEGPPRRRVPILLRQTSFSAVAEAFVPAGADPATAPLRHTARFGEVEQRGAALTPAGRARYDACLAALREEGAAPEAAFAAFPDDFAALHAAGLAYARYVPTGRAGPAASLAEALARGLITAEPITYEDFLPVSAAGIFRSNLAEADQANATAVSSQAELEAAIGRPILDPFALYQAIAEASAAAALTALGCGLADTARA
ncbi:2-oxoadipate dioxygenase/decarboxylase family protein [Novosphingobium piscinae]|uniref:2-oxoadipate dioxygenase/decarboxylase n=1 Tax=Novosphingobium piscinae TaxID=1507448 RepID=A0A7X1FVI1_9SPHN|nr:VOC family protein [Novosphingobium piscinae]MBC2667644.1 VOC family protein [Novosphingobium piscinae]